MNNPFGQQALRLYALAARALGWRPGDFWTATPAELAAALAPPVGTNGEGLNRSELEHMMEQDNGR